MTDVRRRRVQLGAAGTAAAAPPPEVGAGTDRLRALPIGTGRLGLVTTARLAPNRFDLHPPFQIDGSSRATCQVTGQTGGAAVTVSGLDTDPVEPPVTRTTARVVASPGQRGQRRRRARRRATAATTGAAATGGIVPRFLLSASEPYGRTA
jgi:hypothetical protein